MVDDVDDLDPERRHSEEPAEGDEEPGSVWPSRPHAEDPSEGSE